MVLLGQGENVVILSAHYDTVRNSVGANASGVSVLLTLAAMPNAYRRPATTDEGQASR